METGTACLNYLKKHDIGRISALALDKMAKYRDDVATKFKAPENAPRLVDLIQVENAELKTAFYHYLRNTLVAENMEQAKRIAFGKQRFRVVTLNGEVIESSGAMAGGGKEKMSGKMGQQIATKKDEIDLNALERKLHSEEEKLGKILNLYFFFSLRFRTKNVIFSHCNFMRNFQRPFLNFKFRAKKFLLEIPSFET